MGIHKKRYHGRYLLAVTLGSTVAAALIVGGAALSASAHTPDVTGVASCASDGTYSVTWTYTASDVPDGVEDEAKVIAHDPSGSLINGVDGQLQLSSWTTHQGNTGAGPVEIGNWSTSYTQTNIPGTATSATSNVQSDWNDGVSGEAYGTITLDGNCSTPPPPVEKVASASVSTTPATCTSPEVLVYGDIENADFSGTANGTTGPATYQVIANAHDGAEFANGGDQEAFNGSLSDKLTGGDCAPPIQLNASAHIEKQPPTCTSGATLVYKDISNAAFSGTPEGTEGPVSYDVVATAKSGHAFPNGAATQEFTGTLAGPLTKSDCTVTPVVPVLHEPTCTDQSGSIAVPTQPTGVVVTKEGNKVTFAPAPGYFFADGTVTSYTLDTPPTFVDCNAPPSPKVTVTYKYTVDCDFVLTTASTTTTTSSVSNSDGSAYVDGTPVVTTASSTKTVDAAYLTTNGIPQPAECAIVVVTPPAPTSTPAPSESSTPVQYSSDTTSLAETGKTTSDYNAVGYWAFGALAVLIAGGVILFAIRRRHPKEEK